MKNTKKASFLDCMEWGWGRRYLTPVAGTSLANYVSCREILGWSAKLISTKQKYLTILNIKFCLMSALCTFILRQREAMEGCAVEHDVI